MEKSKWILTHAIHRHTFTSRDIASPEPYDTKELALQALEDARIFYRRIGYVIWWAYLKDPEGHETLLEQDGSYW